MIPLLIVAASLPGLYWDQGVETAPAVKKAGVECVLVPPARVDEWKAAGICARPADTTTYEKLPAPSVKWRMNLATASQAPWIVHNQWRLARGLKKPVLFDGSRGSALLAAAEAFAWSAEALVVPAPVDIEKLGAFLRFLKTVEAAPMPALYNIAYQDDGSFQSGEAMNLLSRKNLLYRVTAALDPKADLNVRIGMPDYPKDKLANPGEFAALVRSKLTDEKRLLRIYGSDVVIGRLTGEGGKARLHLINYSQRPAEGVRVRVVGPYRKVKLAVAGKGVMEAADVSADGTAVEFTLPWIDLYAVVDLQ